MSINVQFALIPVAMTAPLGCHGTETAYNRLFHLYMPVVHSELRKYRLSPQVRAEIAQDVALVMHTHLGEMDVLHSVAAWVRTVAKRQAINALKRCGREVPLEDMDAVAIEALELDIDEELETCRWERLGMEAFHAQIEEEGDSNRGRAAHLHYVLQQPVADTAMILSLPRNTVLSHLRRFRLQAQKKHSKALGLDN